MGAFDDAIREHLDLKRRQGASEEELKRQEDEALGRGRPRAQLSAQPTDEPSPSADESLAGEPQGAFAESPDAFDGADLSEAEVADASSAQSPVIEEAEPDEVLPEEALELDRSPFVEAPGEAVNGSSQSAREVDFDSPGREGAELDLDSEDPDVDSDVLEESPRFLDEEPEQDSLWFERKPPKDFDFDE
jgi:hypothetical protein